MFFCILFNYTVLRDTKDVLLVTAPKSGAEVIPFLKTYCNLPSAIGFAALYAKLCDRMEQKTCFTQLSSHSLSSLLHLPSLSTLIMRFCIRMRL
jgi:AAA family ATP:ADP antiporter